MTQVVGRSKATAAVRRVDSYRKRFGVGHVYLACYAALPLALTPDLLYRLWANFQRDTKGELLEIPWIAVSDLLLSNLCEEVGEELYEMENGVREVLLKELRSNPQLGEARLREVAEFVLAYVEPQLKNPDADTRDLAEVQQWRSLAYIEPEMAARSIAQRLARLDHGDKSEWLRMARVVEPLAEPLVAFEPLVDYTRGMAAFVRGRSAEALELLKKALGMNREMQVAGVRLTLPEELRSLLEPEIPRVMQKHSWIDFLLGNRRWVGVGAGLLVVVGSGIYMWQNPKSSNDAVSNLPMPSANSSLPSPMPMPSTNPPLPSPTLSPSPSPSPSIISTPSTSPTANTSPVLASPRAMPTAPLQNDGLGIVPTVSPTITMPVASGSSPSTTTQIPIKVVSSDTLVAASPGVTTTITNGSTSLPKTTPPTSTKPRGLAPVSSSRRIALVIGNGNYDTSKLLNPTNDATDMAQVLKELGFEVILLTDGSRRQMEEAINLLNANLRRGGVGLFYYAGNGVQISGENYLIPIGAKIGRESDVAYEAVPLGKVLGAMEDAGNPTNLLLIDACRDNPFQNLRSSSRGLAGLTGGKGTLISYSTSPGGLAMDGDGRNSPYTASLLENIRTPGLPVESLLQRVRQSVIEKTKGQQIPWETSSLIGDFSFNPQPAKISIVLP
jgi:hypothetical protein